MKKLPSEPKSLNISKVTDGRFPMEPGTLYTILAKFEKDKFTKEIGVEGRKRTYSITPYGRKVYELEIERLEELIQNARKAKGRFGKDRGDIS